jgi:hypothetical protein
VYSPIKVFCPAYLTVFPGDSIIKITSSTYCFNVSILKELKNFLFEPLPNWLAKTAKLSVILLIYAVLLWMILSLLLWILELVIPGSVID